MLLSHFKGFVQRFPKEQIEELNQLAMLPDEAIDTSGIPEQINWENAVRGRFYVEGHVGIGTGYFGVV